MSITYKFGLDIDRYVRNVEVDKVELLNYLLAEFGDEEEIRRMIKYKITEQKMQDYVDKFYDDIRKREEEEQKKKDAEKVECKQCKKLYTKKGVKAHEKRCVVGLKEVNDNIKDLTNKIFDDLDKYEPNDGDSEEL